MIDVPTIGMIVMFLMAFGIVSWQSGRVHKAEELVTLKDETLRMLGEEIVSLNKRLSFANKSVSMLADIVIEDYDVVVVIN